MSIKESIFELNRVKQKPNFLAYVCLIAVCFFWGTTWVVSTWTVRQGIPALQIAAIRQLIAGSLICGCLLIFHKGKIAFPTLKETLILSLLNFILSNALSTWGVQYVPGGMASIVGATYPLWLVFIYTFYYKRSISFKVWLGMVLAFFGLTMVFYPSIQDASAKGHFLFGFFLSIFSTFTWALGTVVTKNQTAKDVNPYFSFGLQMLISGSILSVTLHLMGFDKPITDIPFTVWQGIIFLTLAGSIIAFTCFVYALKHLPAEQVSIYAYINPLVALMLSSIFLDERITTLLVLGAAIVITGVYLINVHIQK